MASSPDFVNFICEQLEGLGAVRSRKMFGEYMVYLNDKPVIIICDDRPMVKMLPCLDELLRSRPVQPPYEGAKDHYLLDPDDRETLREAARLACQYCSQSILSSGLTFFAATIGVAAISKMELLKSICLLISRGAVISMGVIILVLPCLLMLLDPLINRKLRKEEKRGQTLSQPVAEA